MLKKPAEPQMNYPHPDVNIRATDGDIEIAAAKSE
jgi:hypothetical protein